MPKDTQRKLPRVKLLYDIKKYVQQHASNRLQCPGEEARFERMRDGLCPGDELALNIRHYTPPAGFHYAQASEFNFSTLPHFGPESRRAQINHVPTTTTTKRKALRPRDVICRVRKLHDEMEANTIVTQYDREYAFANTRNATRAQVPWKKTLVFHDDTPRQILAGDGAVLVASFPSVLSASGLAYLNQSIGIYTKTVPPKEGCSKTAKKKAGKYHAVANQVTGEIRLSRGWHQLGGDKSGVLTGSKDAFGSVVRTAASAKFLQDIQPTSWMVNEAVRLCDPQLYLNTHRMRTALEKKHPITRLYGQCDALLFEGRELLFNRQSDLHTDSRDPPGAFAGLLVAGEPFSGGDIHLPSLRAKFRLWPGDFILIRGRILPHKIEYWEGASGKGAWGSG
ncbi:hypothetical protein BDZ89DRAFT_1148944 [Hymenopellis radicata]|nr:hypothetical protein BDZ89DRAFT_1148944 [Hymenopellis radicata]